MSVRLLRACALHRHMEVLSLLINGSIVAASAVAAGQVVYLPNGMVGYTWARKYRLAAPSGDNRFRILWSLDSPELAFLVTNPFDGFPDYEIELPTEDARFLNVERPDDLAVLVTVGLSEGIERPLANLMAPIVVNTVSGVAVQVALHECGYEARTPMSALGAFASSDMLRQAA